MNGPGPSPMTTSQAVSALGSESGAAQGLHCSQGPRRCDCKLQSTWEGHMGGACEAQAEDPAALRYQVIHRTTGLGLRRCAKLAEVLELEFACQAAGGVASPMDITVY